MSSAERLPDIDYLTELDQVFGSNINLLKNRIITYKPKLTESEVILEAWKLIPKVTATNLPLDQKDLVNLGLQFIDYEGNYL